MNIKLKNFIKPQLKTDLQDIRSGDTIQVHQKISVPIKSTVDKKEKDKKRKKIQIFEGLVLAKRHGKGITSTITVRKVISGIGVERIFPLHSPNIEKIKILKRAKVRRAKLYFLRTAKGKRARLKQKDFSAISEPIKPKIVSSTSSDITKKLTQNKEKENNKQEVKKN